MSNCALDVDVLVLVTTGGAGAILAGGLGLGCLLVLALAPGCIVLVVVTDK